MICPVCGLPDLRRAGRLHPYRDVETEVFDCDACGSRFTPHQGEVYERLHRTGAGAYGGHEADAHRAAEDIAAGNLEALGQRLRRSPKQSFVLDALTGRKHLDPLLEMGCSRGHLSAYLLARGRRLLGVDIAPSAVAAARERFGDHFVEPGDPRLEAEGPFGAAFHLGTVGCVAQPFAFTLELLGRLRPGGLLLFNAPNAEACRGDGRLWVLGTPPPDLVTLFSADTWREAFPRHARSRGVEVEVEVRERPASGRENLYRRWRRGDPPPRPALFGEPAEPEASPSEGGSALRRAVGAALDLTGRALPPKPAETGLEVVIRRPGASS